jgi:hypothetical protein
METYRLKVKQTKQNKNVILTIPILSYNKDIYTIIKDYSMALKREHCSIKAVATALIGILLLSTVDIVHAQMQVTAKGDEYSLYYGFERYGIIGNFPETWTNDIVYDHNNNRIILTDHTLSDAINRWTVQIYDTEGRLLNHIAHTVECCCYN